MTHAVCSADAQLQAGTIPLSRAAYAIAIVFSTFQIYTAAYSPLSSGVVRAIHVGFLLLSAALGQPQQAIDSYKAAIRIDELSYPAKVNLAML